MEKIEYTTEQIAAMVRALRPSNITDVYSGRPGCACGCRGSYRYSSEMVEHGSAERGYRVTADEVNDAQVKKVLGILQDRAEECEFFGTGFSLELETKAYAVYLPEKGRDRVLQWHVEYYAKAWVKNGTGREFSHWRGAAGCVMQLKGDGLSPPRGEKQVEEVQS